MVQFPREIRTNMRSIAEIETERNRETRSNGVVAFVNATNAPDGSPYGYQSMLELLFQAFEADHGPEAAIGTVLAALKPVLRHHHDLAKVRAAFEEIINDVGASQ